MTLTPEKKEPKNFNLENLALPMRFILPIMFGIFFYAYSGDQNRNHQDFADVKDGQAKTWTALKAVDSKIDAVRDKEGQDFTYVLEHYVKPQSP